MIELSYLFLLLVGIGAAVLTVRRIRAGELRYRWPTRQVTRQEHPFWFWSDVAGQVLVAAMGIGLGLFGMWLFRNSN